MSYIRKISVGPDYKNAMHYVVGKECINSEHTIHSISNEFVGVFDVFITNSKNEVQLWKRVENCPVTVEFNIITE